MFVVMGRVYAGCGGSLVARWAAGQESAARMGKSTLVGDRSRVPEG